MGDWVGVAFTCLLWVSCPGWILLRTTMSTQPVLGPFHSARMTPSSVRRSLMWYRHHTLAEWRMSTFPERRKSSS